MTPEQQYLLSVRYLARKFAFIPLEPEAGQTSARFAIFDAKYTYITTISKDQLGPWLGQKFKEDLAQNKRKTQTQRRDKTSSNLSDLMSQIEL